MFFLSLKIGIPLCDIWIIMDVLCCTASILHLVAIAIDRYLAITRINYIREQKKKPIYIMLIIIWLLSLMISLPTRFHLTRNDHFLYNECNINKDYLFTIFSTVIAFYLPMIFLIGIYVKIYQVAKKRIRKKSLRGLSSITRESSIDLHNKKNIEHNDHDQDQDHRTKHKHFFKRSSICINNHLFNCPFKMMMIEMNPLSISNEYLDMISTSLEKETSSPYLSSDPIEYCEKYDNQQNIIRSSMNV
ncbi:unnamed protein product [Schistosoma mattheei]|uniref:G-protein coupled receptors family 1 profile domain-containing protein n=1 Tax=Schistosoma mattheei TaxID=31246 RepID=A0AA85BNH8_9TREM|nr:unnamed protein product [Schistosoma mattheei]